MMNELHTTATSGVRWVSDEAKTWGFAKSRRRFGARPESGDIREVRYLMRAAGKY
jgi:hypothetical protein